MNAEDTYLRSVERMLSSIAPEHRADVLDDLRGHFADAEESGRPVDDIIRGLGTPADIAERAQEEFGVSRDADHARAERAWRVLQGAAVIISVVTGVVVAFIMPSFIEGPETTDTTQTLVSANGLWVALIALVPALIAAVPLVVPRRTRVVTSIIAGVVLTFMALVGGFTIGGFFLPSVLLTWTALFAWLSLRGRGVGIGWRIVGAVVTPLPVVASLAAFGVFPGPGRYADTAGPDVSLNAWAWPFLAVVLLLAVLIVLGYRTAGWVLAAIGLAVILLGLISGELMTMLFIWLGGIWITVGLAHAVTAPRR